ncbi:ribosomal L7Ae/L30e/S12e/Gadd45 family protein [Clostridium felsineum]|uniref:Ribosome-associated protein L7Ae-like protein n=1 Tax=Clostridium felsineum TaxID=36839 RepID=A0A1S8KXZ7_9CLOT|nr:ribosomal L7Ae/L30e/S12e/Gadd45 family protein [Clostridium felsineum]MCR3758023.1 ribosomal L7Ae/L30e/S12e/Gadd45 family protein [Clostridium felsineum]URZ03464.1 Ribosome-associated protein L7Ae-like protein [Clostridium felsineum]URZ08220.1 Ribosome-associated protein L7Ae-like protein [Clostridium felsineum]URZ13251.1 Ribosome-associated protein L7Ae-like protein [Clostridium felsineum]URZ14768.1 Ribosome-associated protein L7Ae-like protein [Clostridium felsineum DSM 794]
MVNRLPKNRVVGMKQSLKAINEGKAELVYIAKDAENELFQTVEKLAKEHSLQIVYIDTMKELGKLCNIDVEASTAVVLK